MTRREVWIVLRVYRFDANLTKLDGSPVTSYVASGPDRFVPVFDTREEALEWAGGDESLICMLGHETEPTP